MNMSQSNYSRNKSVENLLISSHEVINSISTSSFTNDGCTENIGNGISIENIQDSSISRSRDSTSFKQECTPLNIDFNNKDTIFVNRSHSQRSQNNLNKSDSTELTKSTSHDTKKEINKKKKSSWYKLLYPTYKSRSMDFRRIFKDVPDNERLVVDYSCALQREILVHGRLYVSQNYICFYANIFTWETLVCLRWKDVKSLNKEKTALVIPNAISVSTANDKFFFTSFGTRDKTFLMLFRVWQNALLSQAMSMTEMWELIHALYGDELGLTSDDEDYIPPLTSSDELQIPLHPSMESFSESETQDIETSLVSPILKPISETSRIHLALQSNILDQAELSDTTESDGEKQALETGIRGNVLCTSQHEGRLMKSVTFPVSIDYLFTLLFTNSKFFLNFHTARKTTDLVQSVWTQNDQTGQKERTISLKVSLNQTIGPKSSQVTETQIMLPCSEPGYQYCIDVESLNAGIPYADSFSICTHYCLKSMSENETCLSIYSKINYKKNVWGLMRGMIEKNCWAGMDEYFNSLTQALSVECEDNSGTRGVKRKSKRRKCNKDLKAVIQTSEHIPLNLPPSLVDLPFVHNNQISSNLNSNINNENHVDGNRNDTNILVGWILLAAVLCLMIINGLLYYKLWGLEEAAVYTIMDLHILKDTPKNDEDWIHLLQQQESLHNVEMRRWQRLLHNAAKLLKDAEEILTELQMSIHPTATEKMFSILKPNSKNVNTHTKQKVPSEL